MSKNVTISVDKKLCKQCGICTELCPKKVLKQEFGCPPEVADLDACIGCRLCQLRCPDFAIEVEVSK